MTLLASWLVFPLALGLVTLGCGLLAERVADIRLPAALLLPTGLAVIVTVAGLATMTSATAKFATPLVLSLAAGGLALTWPWGASRFDVWALVTAVAVFVAYGAAVLVSGQATFAGYIILDDTATWLAITDHVMSHGTSLAGLAPSSYEAVLDAYLTQSGYPVGSNLPLGVGGQITGIDIAWLFQPYLAFLAAMLALALYSMLAALIAARWLRTLTALIASQAALLYAYSLWGGLKEVASAALIALVAALIRPTLLEERSYRSAIPLAVAAAALLGALSFGGGAWLGVLVLVGVGAAIYIRDSEVALTAGFLAVLMLVLALPAVVAAATFLEPSGAGAVLTSGDEIGNLFHRLSRLQVLGIWPSGDFRTSPTNETVTRVLLALLTLAGVGGLTLAWRRRAWEILLYAGTVLVGCAGIVSRGSPWVDAKALAIASPVVLFVGLAAVAVMFERGRRVEAAVAAAAIAGGVVWSNVLAYHDVSLAPRKQLSELETIGDRFAGQGPTLMTEYQIYGVRHFLRRLDPEGASTRRRRVIPLNDGSSLDTGLSADVDRFQTTALTEYRTLVLRRSPVASRPPSPYALVWKGRHFEVWQRSEPAEQRVLEHLPLGGQFQPGAVPECRDVIRLGNLAAAQGGRLAAVRRARPSVIHLRQVDDATQLLAYGEDPRVFYLHGVTRFELAQDVPIGGRYTVWLGGTVRSRMTAAVDGTDVGSVRHEPNWPGHFIPLGTTALTAGSHTLVLRYSGPDSHPGSAGVPQFGTGPVILARETAERPVFYVDPSRALSLCGSNLDWVEAVAP